MPRSPGFVGEKIISGTFPSPRDLPGGSPGSGGDLPTTGMRLGLFLLQWLLLQRTGRDFPTQRDKALGWELR